MDLQQDQLPAGQKSVITLFNHRGQTTFFPKRQRLYLGFVLQSQLLYAQSSIYCTPFGILIVFTISQSLNAFSPIPLTRLGITIDSNVFPKSVNPTSVLSLMTKTFFKQSFKTVFSFDFFCLYLILAHEIGYSLFLFFTKLTLLVKIYFSKRVLAVKKPSAGAEGVMDCFLTFGSISVRRGILRAVIATFCRRHGSQTDQ